ncbi:MAG: hypothetical protein AAF532_01320 [Planctomycetota bacterium]
MAGPPAGAFPVAVRTRHTTGLPFDGAAMIADSLDADPIVGLVIPRLNATDRAGTIGST